MKTAAMYFALSLSVLCGTVQAHPGHAGSDHATLYGVSWMGVLPKSGASIGPGSTPDFWKKAFVSKYRISGFAPDVSGF
jgi:hypothetical protein